MGKIIYFYFFYHYDCFLKLCFRTKLMKKIYQGHGSCIIDLSTRIRSLNIGIFIRCTFKFYSLLVMHRKIYNVHSFVVEFQTELF